jgi:hypothetical protein
MAVWYVFSFNLPEKANSFRKVMRYCFVMVGKIIIIMSEEILVYKSQQDAHVTEFILSDNCSTCFGRHYHSSTGTQNNCNYSFGNRYTVLLSAAIVEELELI